MSDLATVLDTIQVSQASKEVTANSNANAESLAAIFARRDSACAALTFCYYGGRVNGTLYANGAVNATASNTNYVVVHRTTYAVSIATTTTNWNNATTYGRAYLLTAGAATITNYEDHRFSNDGSGIFNISSVDVDLTLAPITHTTTYASSVTLDISLYDIFDITLTGAITITMSGGASGNDGKITRLRLRQDGTGSRVVTFASGVRFGADIPSFTASTAASKLDQLALSYTHADVKYDVLAVNKGF